MFALAIFVLALRLAWVPLHLAHEVHEGWQGGLAPSVHLLVEGHDHEEGDHEDHSPHAVADHLTHLISRQPFQGPGLELLEVADPIEPGISGLVQRLGAVPCAQAPRPPPPRPDRARAPPAA